MEEPADEESACWWKRRMGDIFMVGVTVSGPCFWKIDVDSVRLNVEDPGTVEIR